MQIQLKNAVEHFYSSHSLDLVFMEAVANSIDAGATKIEIDISIESFNKPDSLSISFKDNGCGFNKRNFDKFSRLLDVDGADHKGVGRLVYLQYFNNIKISSIYDKRIRRDFSFNFDFAGNSEESELSEERENGSILTFESFSNQKINSYSQLLPEKIKENLLDAFIPIFFQKKTKGDVLSIIINLATSESNQEKEFYNKSSILTLNDVPELNCESLLLNDIDIHDPFNIYYNIAHEGPRKLTTKICVDGRALPLKLLSPESIPSNYQVVILVTSNMLQGRTNASRQSLELPDNLSEAVLVRALSPKIAEILAEHIPSIPTRNSSVYREVDRKYPHLAGFYDKTRAIGLVSENHVIEESQKTFFKKQKQLLDNQDNLNDRDYYTALEFASRSLTEYILYRKLIIDKIQKLNKKQDENSIHELIVPRRKTYRSGQPYDQYFTNNVWLLDDKFMTYDSVISEHTLEDILKEIGESTEEKKKDRPDIAIYFSHNPEESTRVDAVIVELKKYGIKLAKQEEVISQLRQRARVLLKYHPDKIERMWYYGIAEMTDEFVRALKEEGYRPLFSKGQAYYKQIHVMESGTEELHPIDVCIMNYETFVQDAEARNDAFFNFLKKRIQSFAEKC